MISLRPIIVPNSDESDPQQHGSHTAALLSGGRRFNHRYENAAPLWQADPSE